MVIPMCLMGCARQHVSGHGSSRTRLWLRSVTLQVFDCHRCHRWFHPPGGGAVDLGSTGICNCCPYPPVLVVLPGRCGRVCSGGIPTGCGRKGSGDMIMAGWDGIDLTLLVCACLSACSPPLPCRDGCRRIGRSAGTSFSTPTATSTLPVRFSLSCIAVASARLRLRLTSTSCCSMDSLAVGRRNGGWDRGRSCGAGCYLLPRSVAKEIGDFRVPIGAWSLSHLLWLPWRLWCGCNESVVDCLGGGVGDKFANLSAAHRCRIGVRCQR